jgi:type I site-specific restriction endonuclease
LRQVRLGQAQQLPGVEHGNLTLIRDRDDAIAAPSVARGRRQGCQRYRCRHDRRIFRRLCPDLFGPGLDKKDFRIFDFCYNFDFFKMNPDGIERGGGMPLGARLFRARVELLGHTQRTPALAQLGYLQAMQETEFWVGIDIAGLEEMRLRLRELVPLPDKTKRHIVFTDFEDEITGVNEDGIIDIPRMTGLEYQWKVERYLQGHLSNIVIHRLRTNQPLTKSDLQELETMLVKIGEADGEALLKGMLAQSRAPSLVHFVRGLVGMDRAAAQAAFSKLLSNQSLSPPQIRFVEMIIEQLTARGVIEPGALYEAPFTSLPAGGPDGLFAGKGEMIAGIFQAIEATQPAFQSSAG